MSIMKISLFLNAAFVIFSYIIPGWDPEARLILGSIFLTAWMSSFLGVFSFYSIRRKGAAIMAIAGFAFFIPIGFLGIRELLKQLEQDRKRSRFGEDEVLSNFGHLRILR